MVTSAGLLVGRPVSLRWRSLYETQDGSLTEDLVASEDRAFPSFVALVDGFEQEGWRRSG
jgi:hypothetical protein